MIRAICIDDSNLPSDIPKSHRIVESNLYTITHVYNMANEEQEGIMGCDIKEIDLVPLNLPYECWKMDRFGVVLEDLEELMELAQNCSELNDLNLEELFDEQVVIAEPEELEPV